MFTIPLFIPLKLELNPVFNPAFILVVGNIEVLIWPSPDVDWIFPIPEFNPPKLPPINGEEIALESPRAPENPLFGTVNGPVTPTVEKLFNCPNP